jgi:hypothetical protein
MCVSKIIYVAVIRPAREWSQDIIFFSLGPPLMAEIVPFPKSYRLCKNKIKAYVQKMNIYCNIATTNY